MRRMIVFGALCLVQGLVAETLDLNGEWKLDYFKQPEPFPVRTVPLAVAHETVTATVPGCCEMELVKAGKLPAPEVGLNVTRFRPYEGYQWLYSRKFAAVRPTGAGRACLVFDGIDTLADVFLNGQKVGEAANMLVPYRFDVTSVLRDGENEVAVLIRSAILEAREQTVGQLGRRHACGGGDDERIRKAAYMGGWDIFPRLYVSGLWRGVRLETDAGERIDQPAWIVTELDPTNRTAALTVQCRVRAPFERLNACRLRYGVSRRGKTLFRTERPFVVFQNNLEFMPIRGFELWWPRGWGEQALYDAVIELVDEAGKVLAESRSRIGFRSIRLEYADNCGKDRPGQFLFRVNGEPCYIRGTNWVPLDAIPSRGAQFLESTLALCADLNCNMIRVWGGGVYECDRFYERCDELGFMVWQDFMTGCQPSPQDDAYAAVTRDEVLKTVLRLRNHPSIALWSGNNETDWSFEWHACDPHRRRNPNDDRSSRKTIPGVLFEYDVTRDYLPSSPYFSPDVASGRAQPAEEHLWGARGAYKVPYYTNAPCHFASEMGYHGCPGVASLKRMMTPACVFPWTNPDAKDPAALEWNREWQLKAANPYDTPGSYMHPRRNALMTNQCRLMFGEVPRTLEDFVAASQIVQAEALKTFVELFRSRKFTRMNGLVWWNVRDGWPQISDAVVDYYGAAKPAYEAIRTAQRDQIVCVTDDHSVWAVNDARTPVPGEVRLTDAESGKVLMERSFEIPANGKLDLGRVPFSGQGCIRIAARLGGRDFRSHFLYGDAPFSLPRVRAWLEERPLLVVNCDNDHYFKAAPLADELPIEERFSEAGLRKYIDLIARGGRVTHVFMCAVGQRANYDSKLCDPIWMALDEAKARQGEAKAQDGQISLGLEWPRNVKRFHDLGIDPYKVWIDYCRSTGKVQFWLSQRMNDIHNSDMGWNIRTSRFWYEHPELRRKDRIDPTWKDGSGWPDLAFDYSKPEVREYEFAVFKELVDRYDADGFELDFMRWWQNLSPRKGREQAPILTAFIARCRRYLDGLEKARGHRIGLAARCASSYEVARELGMDAEAWAREGLVDIVAVANFFAAADFDCDLAGWKRRLAAANPRVKVVASACDNIGCADEIVTFTPAAVRGFADIAAQAGADGLYFFNYAWFTHACRDVFRDEDLSGRPRGDRRYPCSYHDCTADDDAMKCRQLPVEAGRAAALCLNVGSRAADDETVSVVVGYDGETAVPRVALNGVPALSAEPVVSGPCAADRDVSTGARLVYGKNVKCAFRCRVPSSALKAGHNAVSVSAVPTAHLVWAEIDVKASAQPIVVCFHYNESF